MKAFIAFHEVRFISVLHMAYFIDMSRLNIDPVLVRKQAMMRGTLSFITVYTSLNIISLPRLRLVLNKVLAMPAVGLMRVDQLTNNMRLSRVSC